MTNKRSTVDNINTEFSASPYDRFLDLNNEEKDNELRLWSLDSHKSKIKLITRSLFR